MLKKLLRIIVFAVVCIVMCEICLQIQKYVTFSLKEYRNILAYKNGGDIMVLCLGDSMTASGGRDAYPFLLQDLLNKEFAGKFSVINKAEHESRLHIVLMRGKEAIEKYSPQIVVAMFGDLGNEDELFKKREREFLYADRELPWLKWSRIYSLARPFAEKNFNKILLKFRKPEGKTFKGAAEDLIEVDEAAGSAGFFEKAWRFRASGEHSRAKKMFEQALNKYPNKVDSYHGMGWYLQEQGDSLKALECFEKAGSLSPADAWIQIGIGRCYVQLGEKEKAIQAFIKSIELNDEQEDAWYDLAKAYVENFETEEALNIFNKAIIKFPESAKIRFGLSSVLKCSGLYEEAEKVYEEGGRLAKAMEEEGVVDVDSLSVMAQLCFRKKQYKTAIEYLRQAIAIVGNNEKIYCDLARAYMYEGELKPAISSFKKALEINSDYYQAYGGLAVCLEKSGEYKKSEEYFKKASLVREKNIYPVMQKDVQAFLSEVKKEDIIFVAVQYPMLEVDSLKKLLGYDESVVFVDNEKSFKDGVRQDGYDAYFVDSFGGEYGHCTKKGNMLIARNIMQALKAKIKF